jgi:hypothetical protein
MKTSICSILFCLVLWLFSCAVDKEPTKGDNENVKCPGQYVFTITDTCKRPIKAGFPYDTLALDNYLPDSSGRYYCVEFSPAQDTVCIRADSVIGIIITDSVIGVLDTVTAEYREYFVETHGTGGRFIIWINTDPMRAEYTIYGSGLPIVWSERGILKEVQ